MAGLLHELATVDAIAWGLSRDLEPISEEDRAIGAEPLSKDQIQDELAKICEIVKDIVLQRLEVEPAEWGKARLAVP